jgi:hypothetical protein
MGKVVSLCRYKRVTCYITTDRVKRKVIYLQTQKFK